MKLDVFIEITISIMMACKTSINRIISKYNIHV